MFNIFHVQLQNHKVQRLARRRLLHVNTSESFEAKIPFKSELSHKNMPSVKNHDSLAIKRVALAQYCMRSSKQGQWLHLCKKHTPGWAQSQLCCSVPTWGSPGRAEPLGSSRRGGFDMLSALYSTPWGAELCAQLRSFPLPYLPVCWCHQYQPDKTTWNLSQRATTLTACEGTWISRLNRTCIQGQ